MSATTSTSPGLGVFSRLVVGVDGSGPGLEACRQAARLVDPDGSLELLCAVDLGEAALAGFSAPRMAEELERDAEAALRAALALVGPGASSRLVNGPAAASLLRELEHRGATLVALGTHGHSRASEIVFGGVAGTLLHEAPCSVLIARPPAAPERFPSSIVVGIDGSAEGHVALAVAEQLAGRFQAFLRVVTALRGKGVDLDRVRLRTPSCEEVDRDPVTALVEAARASDLLVVGSRGLHGLRALGSVSERIAHRAPSSVLVVRRAGSPAAEKPGG